MGDKKIDSAVESAVEIADYSVATATTDGATGQQEYGWINEDWEEYLGYYKSIPELSSVIDAKATWTVGKGFKADEITTMLLDTIKGFGKDTFNTILENMIRTYNIGGDAYCEIIRDEEGNLINLKPLPPETMKHVFNSQGILIRFEQISKNKKQPKTFKPEEIFYLARNRVADEVHGQSTIEKLKDIILAKNEAMADYKKVLHRNVAPLWIFHLNTDDPTEIANFKAKYDKARKDGENMYVPKDVVVPEIVSTSANAVMNPVTWIESLDAKFYEAAQVPKIIVGGSGGFTEAAVKIAYLAFQQTIEEEQLYIEEQVLSQLNLLIELEFPASLENELLSDNRKDKETGVSKPEDTTVGEVK